MGGDVNDLKIARLNARTARLMADRQLISEVLRNPVFELAAGLLLITYLNKGQTSLLDKLAGIDFKAGGETAALVGIIAAQQLGQPGVTALANGVGSAVSSLGKALPLLAAGI
jgi:hypothetical protein